MNDQHPPTEMRTEVAFQILNLLRTDGPRLASEIVDRVGELVDDVSTEFINDQIGLLAGHSLSILTASRDGEQLILVLPLRHETIESLATVLLSLLSDRPRAVDDLIFALGIQQDSYPSRLAVMECVVTLIEQERIRSIPGPFQIEGGEPDLAALRTIKFRVRKKAPSVNS